MTWWQTIKSTPPRRQIDPIECGAVCLQIILGYHGRFVDTKTLRSATGVTRNGANAQAIIDAAKKYGLRGSAKKLLYSEFDHVTPPAMLFVDNCHFVVYEGRRGNKFYINDPARGHYVLDAATFRKRYAHVVVEFSVDETFTKDKRAPLDATGQVMTRRAQYLAMLMGVVSALCVVALARMAGLFQTLSFNIRADILVVFVILMAACLGSLLCALHAWQYLMVLIAKRETKRTTDDLFAALANVSPSFFDERPWSIFERSALRSSERAHARAETALSLPFFASSLVVMLLAFVVITPHAGIFLSLCCTLIFFSRAEFQPHPPREEFARAPSFGKISSKEALKAMGHTELVVDGFMYTALPAKEPHRHVTRQALWHVLAVMTAFLVIIAIAQPLWQLAAFPLSRFAELVVLGTGIAFAVHKLLTRARSHFDETASLERELQTAIDQRVPRACESGDDAIITLSNVSFSYSGEHEQVLHKINLTIKRAEIIGIVGASRAGTSTLMKVIGRIFLPTSGTLKHVSTSAQHHWPRVVVINDESDLPEGSLKDVITLGEDGIDDEKVVNALNHACATDLFYQRPMGLLARIAEHGQNLSASERYRLLLAQALAHKPDVVVLDDFFLSIDPALSDAILTQLQRLAITTIFNSYDGALLAKSTRAVFMHNKAIHKIDRHEHLYFSDQHYRELVRPSVIEDAFI